MLLERVLAIAILVFGVLTGTALLQFYFSDNIPCGRFLCRFGRSREQPSDIFDL